MTQSTKQFYDELAGDYHLIFQNWIESIKNQALILEKIIKKYEKFPSNSLYDCSCGIGTQAI